MPSSSDAPTVPAPTPAAKRTSAATGFATRHRSPTVAERDGEPAARALTDAAFALDVGQRRLTARAIAKRLSTSIRTREATR